jgi:hypothetical protein
MLSIDEEIEAVESRLAMMVSVAETGEQWAEIALIESSELVPLLRLKANDKRRRNTLIYWLYDTRPEKVAQHGPDGVPFYCGKTVFKRVELRLRNHITTAILKPDLPHSRRVLECGENIKAVVMEIVPPNGSWQLRERHWVQVLRNSVSIVTNVSPGGCLPSPEACARMSAARKGKPRSEGEHGSDKYRPGDIVSMTMRETTNDQSAEQ